MTDVEQLQIRRKKWNVFRKYIRDVDSTLGYLYIIFPKELSDRVWREEDFGTQPKQDIIRDFIMKDEVEWVAITRYQHQAEDTFQKLVDKDKIDKNGMCGDKKHRFDFVFIRDFYKTSLMLDNLLEESLEKIFPEEEEPNYVSW